MWQLAAKISDQVREAVRTVPYEEHYVFATPAIQNCTSLVSAIALAAGRDTEATLFDYTFARGYLFAQQSLLLLAQKYGFIQNTDALLSDMTALQKLLDEKVAIIKVQTENKDESKAPTTNSES
jgi:hypothetical protein